MLKEFRDFLMRGNVVDLAVAVVIGVAFTAVITSFVADVLTPLLGLVGLPDFSEASVRVGSADVRYGRFLNALVSFVLVAAAVFFMFIRPMNALIARRKGEPETKECPECLTSIPVLARRCSACTSLQPLSPGPGEGVSTRA
jgi:large conductance mechanosensitive channel